MAYQISLACPRPQTAARETLNLHTVHSAPETADNAVLRLHEADAAASVQRASILHRRILCKCAPTPKKLATPHRAGLYEAERSPEKKEG